MTIIRINVLFCLSNFRFLAFDLAGEIEFFPRRHLRKTRSLHCQSMIRSFLGRDRVFFPVAMPEKLGLFAAGPLLGPFGGETEFY
jgi:hypothetical protein